MPTTMDESFFVRIALTGGSSVSMTSVALTTSICSFLYVCFFNLLIRLLPCRSGKSEYLPSTGLPSRHLPRSHPVRCAPPMASTAILTIACSPSIIYNDTHTKPVFRHCGICGPNESLFHRHAAAVPLFIVHSHITSIFTILEINL